MNKPFMTYKEENEQLTARVRELEEENARLRLKTINLKTQIEDDDKSAIATIDDLKGQLAASQLHAEQLRMALESCYEKMEQMCLNGEWYAPDKAIDLAYTALALPRDTSALDAYVKPIEDSRDWYKRRIDLLQEWQSKMRDPERTIVCDIIANGLTMPEGGRYEIDTSDLSTLTRQRDLAVEALERLEHSFDFGEIAGIEPEACVRPKKFITNILSAIKESEAMAQGEKP